jgi:hypothetical protein
MPTLTPYLIEVESNGHHFPHVFYAEDAEDAVCSGMEHLRTHWNHASIVSATRLDRAQFERAVGRAGNARRRVEQLLDDPRAVRVVEAGAGEAGGVDRAIAAACGVSKGLVAKVLVARGLKVVRGRLVPEREAG